MGAHTCGGMCKPRLDGPICSRVTVFAWLITVHLIHVSCIIDSPHLRVREGRGGGYKELDEQELEEARRRRREAEEVRVFAPGGPQ